METWKVTLYFLLTIHQQFIPLKVLIFQNKLLWRYIFSNFANSVGTISHPFYCSRSSFSFLFISWIDGGMWDPCREQPNFSSVSILAKLTSWGHFSFQIHLSFYQWIRIRTNNKWSQKMKYFSLELPLWGVEHR
jgi:hypothetical protein